MEPRQRLPLGWVAGALVAVHTPGALSAEYADEPFETPPPERRHGFTLGLAGGLSLTSVRGFPNEAEKIGVAEFESRTGLGASGGGSIWIGGALNDWLNLAVFSGGGSASGNGLQGSGGYLGVRVEAFPLYWQGGGWRDLGLGLTCGLGGFRLERDGEEVALGEATSAVGGSVFYELLRPWRLGMGPQLDYGYQFSDSIGSHQLVLGWRTAFYSGP